MRPIFLLLLLTLVSTGCDSRTKGIGAQGVEGHYTPVVDLRAKSLDSVALDVYSDFTCPACQRFDNDTLPKVLSHYGQKISVKHHYQAAPSTQLSPMLLYHVALKRGVGDQVAAQLMKSGLQHKNTPDNDERVRAVAEKFNLADDLSRAMKDKALAEQIRNDWLKVANKVAHFPFVVIEGEIAVDGDEANLIEVIDNLLRDGTAN